MFDGVRFQFEQLIYWMKQSWELKIEALLSAKSLHVHISNNHIFDE